MIENNSGKIAIIIIIILIIMIIVLKPHIKEDNRNMKIAREKQKLETDIRIENKINRCVDNGLGYQYDYHYEIVCVGNKFN